MSTGTRRTVMHRQDLAARPHRPRTVVAVVVVVMVLCLSQLGACSPATGPPPGPQPDAAGPRPLAQRHTWGGLCPEGPCRSTLTIGEDGAWTWSDEAADSRGVVSPREVDLLREAIVSSTLAQDSTAAPHATLPEPAARCEADADGRSVRYGWAEPGLGWQLVDSCERALDPRDPLVAHLEELARRLAP